MNNISEVIHVTKNLSKLVTKYSLGGLKYTIPFIFVIALILLFVTKAGVIAPFIYPLF